jgi:hypothetical protein
MRLFYDQIDLRGRFGKNCIPQLWYWGKSRNSTVKIAYRSIPYHTIPFWPASTETNICQLARVENARVFLESWIKICTVQPCLKSIGTHLQHLTRFKITSWIKTIVDKQKSWVTERWNLSSQKEVNEIYFYLRYKAMYLKMKHPEETWIRLHFLISRWHNLSTLSVVKSKDSS